MNEQRQATNITPDSRKDYRPLKLVNHGHFRDVVKVLDVKDGSQITDQNP